MYMCVPHQDGCLQATGGGHTRGRGAGLQSRRRPKGNRAGQPLGGAVPELPHPARVRALPHRHRLGQDRQEPGGQFNRHFRDIPKPGPYHVGSFETCTAFDFRIPAGNGCKHIYSCFDDLGELCLAASYFPSVPCLYPAIEGGMSDLSTGVTILGGNNLSLT